MKLSPISLALTPLLAVFTANAAVYQVVELEVNNKIQSSYASALNDQGQAVYVGTPILSFPLELDQFDLDSDIIKSILTAEQIAAVEAGNIDGTIQGILINYLRQTAGDFSQPVGEVLSFIEQDNSPAQRMVLRDPFANNSSANEFIYAINNQGMAVGIADAPFSKQLFTPAATEAVPEPVEATYWVPEPMYRMALAWHDGDVIPLLPPFTSLNGGYSVASAINNHGLVAGFGSTGISQTTAENILNLCKGETRPAVSCLNQQARSTAFEQRGLLWQIDSEQQVSVPQVLGILGNKNTGEIYSAPDTELFNQPCPNSSAACITYRSAATAVNDNNIAVGFTTYTDSDRSICVQFDFTGRCAQEGIFRAQHAVIFTEQGPRPLVNQQEWLNSNAVAINNQNLVVGFAGKSINGSVRNKMFLYDHASQQSRHITGFFTSSNTVPRSINDQGQVVGSAEVIIGGTITRRNHAFLYDNVTDTFSDLNKLIGCNLPFNLVDASAINSQGEILATALIRRPLLDALGNPAVNADGVVVQQEQATVVKLKPIANGQPANCDNEQESYTKQGAGLPLLWLAVLGGLVALRRRWF
ncbi:DUF3466 family protein [Arsukibacterium sp.]|uniref:DUF3466 family protein n=1 Tax=Arsukibacterium sp. TaxID=1977258 RepID=UPI002FD90658